MAVLGFSLIVVQLVPAKITTITMATALPSDARPMNPFRSSEYSMTILSLLVGDELGRAHAARVSALVTVTGGAKVTRPKGIRRVRERTCRGPRPPPALAAMSILGPALSRQRAAYFRSLKRWCCDSGSSADRRPGLGGYVTGTGATRGVPAAGGR